MAAGANGDDAESVQRYEGYTDFQSVSNRVAASIDQAIDAYAHINALHIEDARVRQGEAAEARMRIHAAAIKLLPELRANAEADNDSDVYTDILERWVGDGEGSDPPLLDRLDDVKLREECPSWLGNLVEDIRVAGWEIGYLQAGRTVTEEDLEPAEQDARQMFENT
jgi:hypothetical protein